MDAYSLLGAEKKPFIITLIPALFMTIVCSSFLVMSPQAFGFNTSIGYGIATVILVLSLSGFFAWYRKVTTR